ncbi:MAG: glutamate synthase-related protein [Actinomycetota bacterium]
MRPGWDPRAERSACGVGFVAETSGIAGRRAIDAALQALERLEHRGAVAPDGTADGAGLLTPIPSELLGDELGLSLDERKPGRLGLAMLFARGEGARRLRSVVEGACRPQGLEVVAWRPVPVEPSMLGVGACSSMPSIVQAVLRIDDAEAQPRRASHQARRALERTAREEGLDVYVTSLGFDTVTYKALVRGGELARFFPDLSDPRFSGWFAMFHRRFSTNTAPAWERAQPCRVSAHNGEINTLSGNVARMREREGGVGLGRPSLEERLRPLLDERGSDSSMLDETIELLSSEAGPGSEPRPMHHAVAMMLPPAWERHPSLDECRREFHRWHEARMEPWDGPAAVVFSDGSTVGAALDRNGFRPLRYSVADGLVVCASEAGVIDVGGVPVRLGRLGAGEMLLIDPAAGGMVLDPVDSLAAAQPYGAWLARERVTAPTLGPREEPHELSRHQVALGLTREDLTIVVRPMAASGHEAVFSMGDDTPIPPLASFPRPVSAFLRQRFAQVTNPALDHLREGWVLSLRTFLGRRPSLMGTGSADHRVVELATFLLDGRPEGRRLDATWAVADGPVGLEAALDRLAGRAVKASRDDDILVIDHASVGPLRAPVPSILAVGAVHTALGRAGVRGRTSIVADVGDVWSSHDAACLLGVGVDAIVPSLALATVESLFADGRLGDVATAAEACRRYRGALEEGVRKALARLGISALDAYRGARAFDALGLAPQVVDRCFPGVVSPIAGLGFRALARATLDRNAAAFGAAAPDLPSPGSIKHRRGGEYHGSNPEVIEALHRAVDPDVALRSTGPDAGAMQEAHALRRAVSADDPASYRRFASLVQGRPPTAPRDLLSVGSARDAIPATDVEPADAVTRRFSTAAISLGAISSEAHEALAVGAAMAGARSNGGEGGEQAWRAFTERGAAIKQVASARFGVTPRYLASADELQIKIAQGSKPGEGGQLPAGKVSAEIAALRHSQPGIALLSPAPHHDIYSIEDLAQLIFDLRQVNPGAAVSVKLVAEVGVGVVAAGVVKAGADVVHVSGADGGTGASPLSSIRHAGMPWELGLAEVRTTLTEQGLRDGVRVRVDGGFRIGRDVVLAALLGADEFSFGTAALVALGCLMVRSCHLDTCPVGIATQRPELRSRFAGTPQMVATYLRFVAEDVRSILASIGVRSLDDVVGRVDLLRQVGDGGADLDLTGLLAPCGGPPRPTGGPSPRLAPLGRGGYARGGAFAGGRVVRQTRVHDDPAAITTRDRAIGTAIGGHAPASRSAGERRRFVFEGAAGQSFGAFLPEGASLHLCGPANDGVGKGLGGGRIAVVPPTGTDPHHHPALIGNTALYGATAGELFVAGSAGDRFAVRNAGALAVAEGVAANGCEYMTGGVVVVLGPIGPNFGAGMTGGRAYVLDGDEASFALVDRELLDIEPMSADAADELFSIIARHARLTRSARARTLLSDLPTSLPRFRLIRPRDPAITVAADPSPIAAQLGASVPEPAGT